MLPTQGITEQRWDPAISISNHEVGQTDPFSWFALSHTLLFLIASPKWFGFGELKHQHSKGLNNVHLTSYALSPGAWHKEHFVSVCCSGTRNGQDIALIWLKYIAEEMWKSRVPHLQQVKR